MPADTCTGEMASRLLVLGARPFGITPGGGCLALFMTLLQFATMVRIVSDSSWDTLLQTVKQSYKETTLYGRVISVDLSLTIKTLSNTTKAVLYFERDKN